MHMPADDPLAFRFDCGATWLNLLATRGRSFGAHPVERLATVDRLAAWLAASELTPLAPPAEEDLHHARELRELIRPLALATAAATPPPDDAVAALNAYLARPASAREQLTGGDRLRRRPPATTAEALLRIAHQAVDHLTGPDREALKVCPEDDCRGVFTDTSGRRRWCPSPSCASRGRVRAHRARAAAGSARAEQAG